MRDELRFPKFPSTPTCLPVKQELQVQHRLLDSPAPSSPSSRCPRCAASKPLQGIHYGYTVLRSRHHFRTPSAAPTTPLQVRDLYWTARNFRNRVSDFLRYRRVTANMDERFPEATEEDLARCDNVCIICREEMLPSTRNKKLTCGHVFHLHCLRSPPPPHTLAAAPRYRNNP